MADYEPANYRSGFDDDERRAPYATDFGARNERYATGYGYGPTYGGTAGAYGGTYGGATPGTYSYGTYGYGTAGYGAAGTYGTGYGSPYGAAGTGYGATGAYETGYGTGRFGSTRFGRHEPAPYAARHQGTGIWREEGIGERRYPDYSRTTTGWSGRQESRFGEPGRAGVHESVTGLQEFGAFGRGTPGGRRHIGARQYGPY